MPAGVSTKVDKNVDVAGAWKDFLALEAGYRTTRNSTWNGLTTTDPINTLQSAFDTYTGQVKTALDNAQGTFAHSINDVSNYFQGAFDSFQSILSGAGTVADGIAAATTQDVALDNAINNEGGAAKQVQEQSSKRALIYSVQLAENSSYGGTSFELGDHSKLFGDEIVVRPGPEGSHALASLKTLAKDDTYGSISARSSGLPAEIRGGGRALVKMGAIPALCGPIDNIADILEPDGLTFTIRDDMITMEGVHVKGTFHYFPDSNTSAGASGETAEPIKYNRAGECRFNPNGRPNCIDSPYGPMFAPYPDYGLAQGDYPGVVSKTDVTIPAETKDTSTSEKDGSGVTSRLWRFSDVVEYLRFALYTSTALNYTTYWPGYKLLNGNKVTWPAGLGSAILGDGAIEANASAAADGIKDLERELGSQAKMPDKDITDWNLKDALSMVVESAGGYALFMTPNANLKNTLSIVRTRVSATIKGSVTKPVVRRIGSRGELNDLLLHSGKLERDFKNSFSSVSISGDRFMVERQVKFDPSDLTSYASWLTEQSGGDYKNTILPAWTEQDELAFRAYILDDDDNISYEKTPHAFQDAATLFPKVYCAYKINPLWNYLAGTKYASYPRVTPHPQILGHLLTYTTETLEGSQKRRLPLQIPVEVYNNLLGQWELQTKLDGLEIDQEGNFYLTALRENNMAGSSEADHWYTRTWKGKLSDPENMRPNPIRMTVAIVSDVLLETVMAFDDEEANGPSSNPNNDLQLFKTGDPNGERGSFTRPYERQYHATAGSSYRIYARKDSGAVPASLSTSALDTSAGSVDPLTSLLGPNGLDDRTGSGSNLLLDETEFCRRHAQRRFCTVARPHYSGHLVFKQVVMWRPGTLITKLATRGDVTDSRRIDSILNSCSYSYEEQETVMDCV